MRFALARMAVLALLAGSVLVPAGTSWAASDLTAVSVSPNTPGTQAQYDFTFTTTRALNANADTITVTFPPEVRVTSSLDRSQVTITTGAGVGPVNPSVNPVVSGSTTVNITVPNMTPLAGVTGIAAAAGNRITFSTTAGVYNPTAAGTYVFSVSTSQEGAGVAASLTILRNLYGSPSSGARGSTVTVTGAGYLAGSTATVWLDNGLGAGGVAGDGVQNGTEPTLKQVIVSSSGTLSASFPAGNGFVSGNNFINAKDGTGTAAPPGSAVFSLTGSVSVSPASQSIGGQVTIKLADFPPGTPVGIGAITLAGATMTVPVGVTTDATGAASFVSSVPSSVPVGVQSLTATLGGQTVTISLTVTAATLTASPSTVVPNQGMALLGSGFTPTTTPGGGGPGGLHQITGAGASVVTFDGAPLAGVTYPINLDTGGNWAAQVSTGLAGSILNPGTYTITVQDDAGRVGTTTVTVPATAVTVTPASGQRSSKVTVTVTGFPARSGVTILYNTTSVGTINTNSSGGGTSSFLVPLTASIPSTNTVTATSVATAGTATTTHAVPAPSVTVTPATASAGTKITLKGANFPAYNSVSNVVIGGLPALPTSAAVTDGSGGVTLELTLPQLPGGIQTVQLFIGGISANGAITITDPPQVTAVPAAALLSGLQGAGGLELASSFNYDTGKYEAYVPNLGGNALTVVKPNSVLFITVTVDTRVIANGVTILIKARVPTPIPIGDVVSLGVA